MVSEARIIAVPTAEAATLAMQLQYRQVPGKTMEDLHPQLVLKTVVLVLCDILPAISTEATGLIQVEAPTVVRFHAVAEDIILDEIML